MFIVLAFIPAWGRVPAAPAGWDGPVAGVVCAVGDEGVPPLDACVDALERLPGVCGVITPAGCPAGLAPDACPDGCPGACMPAGVVPGVTGIFLGEFPAVCTGVCAVVGAGV